MISTALNELVHRFRSQGRTHEALLVNRSDFETLKRELLAMNCRRALAALTQAEPRYYGVPVAIQENWVI
ncbi:hypothetical protein [Motiliproteus sediminis]|uniref:hypothetical protein n=1 Tax=Motiliproteus sediminis TaxID=1468178 RepID=UPI001AEFD78E|nr:hypothetical protein [Motiliproteus sediminis]